MNRKTTGRAFSIEAATAAIARRAAAVLPHRACLVGVSGIDGSGKGYISEILAESLTSRPLRVALINIDGWLNLPDRRFSNREPGKHFYENGIRLSEAFSQLLIPLRDARSISMAYQHMAETARTYEMRQLVFEQVDVVLVEGIFLFKKDLQQHFDYRIWIDCSLATALDRAVARAQEGLSPAETVAAYVTIYFPAQAEHRERDQPKEIADAIIANDARIEAKYCSVRS